MISWAKFSGGIALTLLLTACVAPMLFDKPGVAPGEGQDDLTDCQVEALAKVPPSTQLRSTSGLSETTYTNCTRYGCTSDTYGGSKTYSVDVNAGLRDRVTVQCMERKGYTLRK